MPQFIMNFDIWLFRVINFYHHPILEYIALGFSWITEFGIFWYLLFIALLAVNFKKNQHYVLGGIFALIGNFILVKFFFFILFRTRPYLFLPDVIRLGNIWANSSFPSGHTLSSFAVSSYFFFAKPKIGKWLLVFSFFVGLSRIYLGMHFPLDVVSGAILGILLGFLVFKIQNKIEPKGNK